MSSELVGKARCFAQQAHEGQFRRDGITPYITHPKNVVDRLEIMLSCMTEERKSIFLAVGWLHDVLEDPHATEASIQIYGIPNDVITEIKILSKTKNETYSDYIESISKSAVATMVKICDMESNLADSPTNRQVTKYIRSIAFLKSHSVFRVCESSRRK